MRSLYDFQQFKYMVKTNINRKTRKYKALATVSKYQDHQNKIINIPY